VLFSGAWNAPEREMRAVHSWSLHSGNEVTHVSESLAVEVSCSDGVFCNGAERYINGRCRSSHPACEDFDSCTRDTCDEARGLCSNVATNQECKCFSDCEADCTGKTCGEDGCGGFCGTCPDGHGCFEGNCVDSVSDGTCAQPLPLLDSAGYAAFFTQTHIIEGDTSDGVDTYFPSCNTLSGAQEVFYEFTVPNSGAQYVGVEAMMSGFDTVLKLQQGSCGGTIIACSDDSTPPAFLGSRVKANLTPGATYMFMCDGYNLEQRGPFELRISFHENCSPDCDGLFCGDNGCGGACGECDSSEQCNSGSCFPNPCISDCANRECGDDGCGGSCGDCDVDNSSYCETDVDDNGNIFYTGVCTPPVIPCDHQNPECNGCGSTQYCATDCQCYDLNTPLADLVVDPDILSKEIYIEVISFSNTSCAVSEGCVAGSV
jgi:hypothetical protein